MVIPGVLSNLETEGPAPMTVPRSGKAASAHIRQLPSFPRPVFSGAHTGHQLALGELSCSRP